MSRLTSRLAKLEQRKAPFPTIGRVIVTQGQLATEQWLKEHPGQPLPELLIVRVIVPPPQPMH